MKTRVLNRMAQESGVVKQLFFFQAEDGMRDFCLSRGLRDVYKRQAIHRAPTHPTYRDSTDLGGARSVSYTHLTLPSNFSV